MIFDARLGQEFWGYAALAAVHVINQLPSSAHEFKTPFEIWLGEKPSLAHLRIFGCTAYRHIPAPTRRKLDRRTQKCRLIGYNEQSGSRVYRVYDEECKQVFISQDIIFEEGSENHSRSTTQKTESPQENDAEPSGAEDLANWYSGSDTASTHENASPHAEEEPRVGQPLPPIDPDEDPNVTPSYDHDTIFVRPSQEQTGEAQPANTPAPSSEPPHRSQQVRQPREMFHPGGWPAYVAIMEEPQTLQQALQSEDAVEWKRAWDSELESLRKNGTWVVRKVPPKRNIVGCRWIFRRKEDGRYKVRLVAKGYSQQRGVDFNETFAPVAIFTTLRVLLALVAESDWELHSMDVKTAFLNGELEEEIYMELPEGLPEPTDPGHVCKLVKAIYGLRQSPRAWYQKVHTFFSDHDFLRSTQDYSLYINYGRRILALVYVHDLVLAAANMQDIGWIKQALTRSFEMKDLGELETFLGLEIARNRSQRLLTLRQSRDIYRILHRHGMQNARPCLTPLDHNVRLQSHSTKAITTMDEDEVPLELYQSAVGSLMYAMLGTRPDLAYAVGLVSQFNHVPKMEHWMAVKRIFRYLAGSQQHELRYGTSNITGGYSDADWGSGEDPKSVGGFVFLLNGAAVSWASKKQTSIALSTTEAEYMAMALAAKEILWLRVLLDELGAFNHIKPMSQLNGDNQGAIALAKNPEYHARTKHIDIQYHFIREHVTSEKIHLKYYPSTDMSADIMMKALPRVAHNRHTQAMGIEEGNGTLREGAC